MTTEQFLATLNDPNIEARRAAAKDVVRKLVLDEPLPVLSRNLIDALMEHLKILGNYIERNYDIDATWEKK
jgi:hypothetical protein